MRPDRQLLAVFVLAIYALASTLGVAFVTCVEQDGSRNVEAIGMSCCASAEDTTSPADTSDTDDCNGCSDHLPAVELAAAQGVRNALSSTAPIPHPDVALPPASACPHIARAFAALPATAPPTRQLFALPRPRSVVLRC